MTENIERQLVMIIKKGKIVQNVVEMNNMTCYRLESQKDNPCFAGIMKLETLRFKITFMSKMQTIVNLF